MSLVKKKICLVGAFAVGKTSLIRRYVEGVFSDRYLTTIGVKIDQKTVALDETGKVLLMIWDLAGSDEFQGVRRDYLRGASGFLAVADGTRRETLAAAVAEIEAILASQPGLPCLLLLNKADNEAEWELTSEEIAELEARFPVVKTSARAGVGVEEAFLALSRAMVPP